MKSITPVILLVLISLVLPGCASISLVNTFKDPGMPAKQYKKLLVVGVTSKIAMRQIFEEVFASELMGKGVSGIPSYTITGVKEKPSHEMLVEAVKKSGADGVITTRLVDIKKDTVVKSGFVMTDRGFIDDYGEQVNYATFVSRSVDVTLSSEAAFETNMFDAETGRMIWSGTSSAVNPEGIITLSRELADHVIKAMIRDGLI